MREAVISGLLAGYGLAIPVGAVAVLMVKMTAETSFKLGAAAAMGATTADALYAVAAVIGGGGLLAIILPVSTPLRWAAFVILIIMAVRIAISGISQLRKSASTPAVTASTPLRSFLIFFGLTALNPWPAIYFIALILGSQASGRSMTASETVAYVVAITVASASWQLFLALCGSSLGPLLTSGHGRAITSLVSGCLIAGLAAHMVLQV